MSSIIATKGDGLEQTSNRRPEQLHSCTVSDSDFGWCNRVGSNVSWAVFVPYHWCLQISALLMVLHTSRCVPIKFSSKGRGSRQCFDGGMSLAFAVLRDAGCKSLASASALPSVSPTPSSANKMPLISLVLVSHSASASSTAIETTVIKASTLPPAPTSTSQSKGQSDGASASEQSAVAAAQSSGGDEPKDGNTKPITAAAKKYLHDYFEPSESQKRLH